MPEKEYTWPALVQDIGKEAAFWTLILYWECEHSSQDITESLHLNNGLDIFDAQVYAEDVIPATNPDEWTGEDHSEWIRLRDNYRRELAENMEAEERKRQQF